MLIHTAYRCDQIWQIHYISHELHTRYLTPSHRCVDAVLSHPTRWRRRGVTKWFWRSRLLVIRFTDFAWRGQMWQNHCVSHELHVRHELHIRYSSSSSHAIPQMRRRNFVTFRTLTEAWYEQNYHLLLWRSCPLVLYFPDISWHC